MIPMKLLKKYGKKADYTYSLGPFPTFELLNCHPEYLEEIVVSSQIKPEMEEKAAALCEKHQIPLLHSDKTLEKIREKEACVMAGVLQKYEDSIDFYKNHVVLVNPSDMGNLGTIIRTCVGFGITNLAVIEPCADLFHPKVIRASMGALFSIHAERFSSFEDYFHKAGMKRDCYPFMLTGSVSLSELRREQGRTYSLIFGNESSGLPDSFAKLGQPVRIRHSDRIDSLNLSMAAGIALYEFTKGDFSE
jgi:TrmH family RNA methyltransferase